MPGRNNQPISPETMRTWRLRRDLTQREAADLFGVSRQAWQHWEIGDRDIPPIAETIMWLWDKYPPVKSALGQLSRMRYAGETIIAEAAEPTAERRRSRKTREHAQKQHA